MFHTLRCRLNFDKCHERSVPLSLSVNHLFVTLGLAFVFELSLRLGLQSLFMSPWWEGLWGNFVTFTFRITCQKWWWSLQERGGHILNAYWRRHASNHDYISGHNVSFKSDPSKTSCAKSFAQSMVGLTTKNSHIAECIKDDGRGQLKQPRRQQQEGNKIWLFNHPKPFFFARFVRAWLKFVRFAVVPVLINADRLAQLVGCRTTVRVVVGSNPGRANIQVL